MQQPLRDRTRIAAAVLVCAAFGAPLRAQDDTPPVASPSAAGRNGVMATALQPGVARGDFEFYVDALSQSPAGTGQTLVRCIVQLPVGVILDQTKANKADLRFRVRAYEAQAALQRLEAAAATAPKKEDPKATQAESSREASARGDEAAEDLLSDFGDMPIAGEAENRTQLESADRSQLLETDFRIVEMALELPAADYVIEVAAENLSRRKRGLLDRLRRRPLAATAKLLVRVPDLRREPALADPGFLIGHGTRSPYATRLYGLLNDSLHVRTTIFGHGTHDLRVRATDRGGEVGWRDSLRLEVQGSRDVTLATSVNQLPAGQYVLQLVVTGPQGTTSIARSFDVAWSLVTWKRSRRDFDLEAELALDEKRYDSYRSLPVGEKEKYLEDFWRSIDPTPETAQNEVMDEFHRRVAHADLNFSEVIRGAMTDRGRVYVHFGPPDEVIAEAVPTHLAGAGGENALQKVDDVYVAEDQDRRTTFDRLGTDNQAVSPAQRAAAQQERARLIGPANEVVSYELWRYNGGGAPLMAEDKGMAVDTGLRVMFVDLDGYGRFIIRKSSVRLNIHGLTTSS